MANKQGIGHDKWADLNAKLKAAGIAPADLHESFVRAAGPGGQHVNKTATAVRLVHVPSGFEVKAQSSRSQAHNRYQARVRLLQAILTARDGAKSEEVAKAEKIRRQKRKRSRRAKAKMVADKRHQGAKKAARGSKHDPGKDG